MTNALPILSRWGIRNELAIGLLFVAGIALLALGFVIHLYARTWLQAYASSATIKLISLIGMSFRQVPMDLIVRSKIILAQAKIVGVSTSELEAHFLAGGNLERTVQAIVIASRSGMPLGFEEAAAIDLAGRNVLEAVSTSVQPRVIGCPNTTLSTRSTLSAVAKDGVELRIQAKVTVRTNINSLIGGATEETIVARVGQGIVSVVGSAESHIDVLCKPELISQELIRQGLDSNTTYEIVSIDIARIDVGSNIGARIRTDQAEADMRVSQAFSESRRAEAVSRRQEMKALISQKTAELKLAEAGVPLAIGTAIRERTFGDFRSKPLPIGMVEVSFTRQHHLS